MTSPSSLPTPDEFPELPSSWIQGLIADAPRLRLASADPADTDCRPTDEAISYEVTDAMTAGMPTQRVATRLAAALYDVSHGTSRHDSVLRHVLALLRFGKAGESGVGLALQTLYREFIDIVGSDRQGGESEAAAEFVRMVANSDHLLAQPDSAEDVAAIGCVGDDGDRLPNVPLVPGEQLLDELLAVLRRYVVFPSEHAYVAIALWITATHGIDCWNAAPRLVINSPQKRCGKTRALDVVAGLCHRPLVTVNATAAAIFRSLDGGLPPTLIIDEADTIFGSKRTAEQNEDLRALLNAGHQRNRPALRCVGNKQEPRAYPTFAMAALAGIGNMPDTITDRAVNVTMRRRALGEPVAQFRARRDEPVLHSLRDRLAVWVSAHSEALSEAIPEMPVEDRAADTWEPLIAIADAVGGRWSSLAREACVALVEGAEDTEADQSLSIRMLHDVRDIFAALEADFLPSSDLVFHLKMAPESPWGDWELTTNKLARNLSPFGIRPGHNADKTQRGYRLEHFQDAFERYIRPGPSDASS